MIRNIVRWEDHKEEIEILVQSVLFHDAHEVYVVNMLKNHYGLEGGFTDNRKGVITMATFTDSVGHGFKVML